VKTPDAVFEALVKEKAASGSSSALQWRVALERLRSTGVWQDAIERIVRACSSPVQASRLAQHLAGGGESGAVELFSSCDGSAHGLESWIAALTLVGGWLEARSRTKPFAQMTGYVACCSAAAPEADLAATTARMLEDYGVE
jgi:hypothetical protein